MFFRSAILQTILPAFVISVFLVGCSSLEVTSDYDRNANFASYKTYSWLEEPATSNEARANDLVIRRIKSAVDNELGMIGLTKVPGNGDLGVVIHGSTQEQTVTTVDTYGYRGAGWGYGYYGWWGPGVGTTTVSHQTYDEGMLILDMVEQADSQLVWRSVATAVLNENSGTQEYLDKVVKRMVSDYPRK